MTIYKFSLQTGFNHGGQAGGKARGLKGQCHDIHISVNWLQLLVRKGKKARGLKGQCHDIQIVFTNRLQLAVRRGKEAHGFKRQSNERHTYLMWSGRGNFHR